MLNFYHPFFIPYFGSHFKNGRHLENFENAELFGRLNNTLNNNNSCTGNNNFKYCFNKLYYDCKHSTVLFIVECM